MKKINYIKFAAPIKYIIYNSLLNKRIRLDKEIDFNKENMFLIKNIEEKYNFNPEDIKDEKNIKLHNEKNEIIKELSIRELLINIGNKLGREKCFLKIIDNKNLLNKYLNIPNKTKLNITINNHENNKFLKFLSSNLLNFAKQNKELLINTSNIWVALSLKFLNKENINLITDLRFLDELKSFIEVNNEGYNNLLINIVPIKKINNNIEYNSTEINKENKLENYLKFEEFYRSANSLNELINEVYNNKIIEEPEILSSIISFNEYIKKFQKEKLNKKLNDDIEEQIFKINNITLFNDKNDKFLTTKNIENIRNKINQENINLIAAIAPKRTGKDFYLSEAIKKTVGNNLKIKSY